MTIEFKKAVRAKSKLRLAISGVSGSGKTYSSLIIAKELGKKIALINTEAESGAIYSDVFDYDVCDLQPPFTPENYSNAITSASNSGYDVIIVDSFSHEWMGEGGILEILDKQTKASTSKNSYVAWGSITPRHNKLVETMLRCKSHIIATMREKAAYDLIKDKDGKQRPAKLGLAPIQREGVEYEFTTMFNMSLEGHLASVSKDRTGLFDGQIFEVDDSVGKKLLSWLNSGEDKKIDTIEPIKPIFSKTDDLDEVKEIKNLIYALMEDIRRSNDIQSLKSFFGSAWNQCKKLSDKDCNDLQVELQSEYGYRKKCLEDVREAS
jgi:hypothetical protein